ncbi:NAD(P)/FAD-dependent oxidoreductase [Nodularia spumigena]|uniref:NAD(P)/FAD-dependent oxidoreductase n=1 Tax=Nodularia spumigena UHCC 0060 TaxID=3110300 RepID=A0ABU5UVS3_NODSP|nr:NAD(P)/FAD-dependent oxidoreductase [Nodularia spumigena]MEA5527419.1 NAD(P)/FAD-dependent oxidoreductase [Nodularia spumigena UHCC 0143]MEA5609963.1 NAD(P)/FAD-dependent oxidoreductase [Nodularia spumigena UHCC 0060]MEA5613306.1 NAD(P)/FAD-dependent oxidoreductase [Nodularia spumigena UHCC 0040]
MTDIAIIGAGMAGLICAQRLTEAGYSVLVVEKSRGLGGRLATRRLYGTWADHGACYLKPQGELFRDFVQLLCDRHIVEVWANPTQPDSAPRYIVPAGMSAIAKFLAQGLQIQLNQRVTAINPTPKNSWCLTLESNEQLTAKALVLAIPAPQALTLLAPLGEGVLGKEFLDNLSSVEFYPSLSAIAGYSATSVELPPWKDRKFTDDPVLGWIGLDSSKRPHPQQPVFVLQSSAKFAELHLETPDLQPVGKDILQKAAQRLALPWLETPEWMQVHRWRYAFPSRPLSNPVLSASSTIPLVCCGDWCGGHLAEDAMISGLAASGEINNYLRQLPLPNLDFFQLFTE